MSIFTFLYTFVYFVCFSNTSLCILYIDFQYIFVYYNLDKKTTAIKNGGNQMKIRKTLKNSNTGKNVTVYEHSNKIIVVISPQGVVIDNTALERKEFDSLAEYEAFEKSFAPAKISVAGPFKKVH